MLKHLPIAAVQELGLPPQPQERSPRLGQRPHTETELGISHRDSEPSAVHRKHPLSDPTAGSEPCSAAHTKYTQTYRCPVQASRNVAWMLLRAS